MFETITEPDVRVVRVSFAVRQAAAWVFPAPHWARDPLAQPGQVLPYPLAPEVEVDQQGEHPAAGSVRPMPEGFPGSVVGNPPVCRSMPRCL
jgi:hypothetical protein